MERVLSDDHLAGSFVELEYVMQKYYDEHCAKFVGKEVKLFRDEQANAYADDVERSMNAMTMSGSMPDFSTVRRQRSDKTADQFLKDLSQHFKSDAILQKDLSAIASVWKQQAIAAMGQEQYDRLSKDVEGKDLALYYVKSRFEQLTQQQLAKSQVPKSDLDYIMKKGIGDSMFNTDIMRTELEKKIECQSYDLYGASGKTKFVAESVTFGLNSLPFLMVPGLGVGGSAAAKAATSTAGRVVVRGFHASVESAAKKGALDSAKHLFGNAKAVVKGVSNVTAASGVATGGVLLFSACTNPEDKCRKVSEAVSGNDKFLDECQKATKTVKSSNSVAVHEINGMLQHKIKLSPYRRSYSPSEMEQFRTAFINECGGDVHKNAETIEKIFQQNGIAYKGGEVSQWMLDIPADKCMEYSHYFAATACEMKACGAKEVKTKSGQVITLDDAANKAVLYSRAAQQLSQQCSEAQEQANSQHQEQQQAPDSSPQEEDSQSTMFSDMDRGDINAAWSNFLKNTGYDGMGDLTKNLGYAIAMLPDMLYGMLSGKSTALKLQDNLIPLAAIFFGMFCKNPLMKMLFMGLGGANLINKGFKELKGIREEGREQRTYKVYDEEPLSKRIRFNVCRGNTMDVEIDGQSHVITLDEDTMNAYRNGSLPLNTLLNVVVDKYDQHQQLTSAAYEQGRSEQMRQDEVKLR